MTAQILDGKALAAQLRTEVAERAAALTERLGAAPRLAIVSFEDEGPSAVYVRSVARAAERVGIDPLTLTLPAEMEPDDVGRRIDALNRDASVAGIVLAEPLPAWLSRTDLAAHIDPAKDVDGASPVNAGWLARGEPRMVPATALAVLTILRRHEIPIAGRRAVVVGRSPVIGRPVAQLLIAADATVVVCHSRTADLAAETRRAEILVVAAGRPGLIGPDMVSPGCVVIDCGITTTPAGVVGDVDFEAVREVVTAITPVPGGVGPVTSVMVVVQAIAAAERAGGMAAR
ncbi:MAG: bifunctional 5,10-methylenetetrahydrofolate dehydrogenase/5,10-methenyltetrahydrofolate cyclohydrolase [Chloroflexi bacterium]|nr:MAG: bifunctional 5,10-methylenetetrahydrofolate dehydrogenase/5,10-methenyltetrahydrofolate cyclohydrolase [Chloroflexota bacterium]